MELLIRIVAGPFLLGHGVGDEAFGVAMVCLLTGSSLGIIGLITSFYRNRRSVAIGFSVAAIAVWLLEALYILVRGDYNFQHTEEVMTRLSSLLIIHPPLLLAWVALINQHSKSRRKEKGAGVLRRKAL